MMTPLPAATEARLIQVGENARSLFGFEHGFRDFNHGAYGACPTEIRQELLKQELQSELNPSRFVLRDQPAALIHQREVIAKYLRADVDCCVFVPNGTTSLNVVLRNLAFGEGDVIVRFSTTFSSCKKTADYIADTTPVTIHEVAVRSSMTDDELCNEFEQALQRIKLRGCRARIAIIDTIVSFPAIRMPFERLTRLCAQRGVMSYIDGSHGVGQISLDLIDLDADFFSTDCHKWLFVPRKCAVLYVSKRNQSLIRSSVQTSMDYVGPTEPDDDPSRFANQFKWISMLGNNNYLCVEAALEWRERVRWREYVGEEAIQLYIHHLAHIAAKKLLNAMPGIEILGSAKDGCVRCAMVSFRWPLPARKTTAAYAHWIGETLQAKYNTFFQVGVFEKAICGRLCAQIYLTEEDLEWVAGVVKQICRDVETLELDQGRS